MSITRMYTIAQAKEIAAAWDSSYGRTDDVIFYAFRILSNNEQDLSAKCKLLKSFYSVPRPDSIEIIVKHISQNIHNIEQRLAKGDLSIVEEIARNPNGTRQFSFATKFCSFHNPTAYPIFDSSVRNALRREGVSNNKFDSDFLLFKKEIDAFIARNSLQGCSYKEIDHLLQEIGTICDG